MGFKTNESFLRFLTMGALGVHQTMEHLRSQGFAPVELERYCGSNKIWQTKVKRLRLPDLLCTQTGLRIEVRAKSDLKIRMSDAPGNPERTWDAGLREDDLIALIACADSGDGIRPAEEPVYFSVAALRESIEASTLGQPKSASEGSERDRTWPATVPSRDGSVLEVTADALVVQMDATQEKPARRQTYQLRGKSPYVGVGDRFSAGSTVLAGAPHRTADLSSFSNLIYSPLDDLASANPVDRYAAAKALRFEEEGTDRVVDSLERLVSTEADERVALEAAATAAVHGSAAGQDRLRQFIWENTARPDLRMEAVLILAELTEAAFARDLLVRVADDPHFAGDEVRQAAVWGLGKAGHRAYEAVLPYIADADENCALHAIGAFGADTPDSVINALIRCLVDGDGLRAPAASEALRIMSSDLAIDSLIEVANAQQPMSNWVLATIGRMPPQRVRQKLAGSDLLRILEPLLLTANGANWLASDSTAMDIAFLLKQDVSD